MKGDDNMVHGWKMTTLLLIFLVCRPGLALADTESAPLAVPELWTPRLAVAFALKNNPDSAMAWQRLESADSALLQARSSFYPRLDVSSSYRQTDNPMYSFGNILNQGAFNQNIDFNDPGRTDDLNLGVKLSYRFYNGGRDRAGIEAAAAGREANRLELGAVRSHLAFGAVRSYDLIVQAGELVRAHETALAAIEASLEVARARYEEGVLLKADLLNLEVQQSRSHENLIQARNALELARQTFLNLLGLQDGAVHLKTEGLEAQELPTGRDYRPRFELQSAAAMVRAAEAKLRLARGGRYPALDGFAAYDLDKGFETDGSGDSWQAGLQLSYNLFDGRMTSAAISGAKADLAEARQRQRKLDLAIGLEVTRAELALREAETRLEVSDKAVEQARESARIYRARFKEGDVLASDLITIENGLTDAQIRRTVAENSRRIAVADLRRSLGLPQFPDLPEESDMPGSIDPAKQPRPEVYDLPAID